MRSVSDVSVSIAPVNNAPGSGDHLTPGVIFNGGASSLDRNSPRLVAVSSVEEVDMNHMIMKEAKKSGGVEHAATQQMDREKIESARIMAPTKLDTQSQMATGLHISKGDSLPSMPDSTELHVSKGDSLPSMTDSISEIPTYHEGIAAQNSQVSAGQVGFAGQRTMNALQEMDGDMAGMGVNVSEMMRQPPAEAPKPPAYAGQKTMKVL